MARRDNLRQGDVAGMQNVDIGAIVECRVVDIVNFGAFVKMKGGGSGLIHISQISEKFVRDIKDFLSVGDEIVAKVVSIDSRGRVQLSIKEIQEEDKATIVESAAEAPAPEHHKPEKERHHHHEKKHGSEEPFEMKMKKFLRQSEDRQHDLRKNIDSKRGTSKRKK